MKYPIQNKWGETVEPQGHMREMVASAIQAARPSNYTIQQHIDVRLRDPIGYFLYSFAKSQRDITEQWADNFLIALDRLGYSINEGDGVVE